jgi:anti-sigma-K factor RskA
MKPENHVTDQIPAFALNILDAAEAAQVKAHLATCAACQEELQAQQEVVGLLSLAIPTMTPSPALKTRLMQEIKGDPAVISPKMPTPKTQTSWWANWRNWFQKRPLWQPVLVVVLALVLISNFQLRQRLDEATTPANFGTVTLTIAEENIAVTGIIIITADGQHGTLVVQNLPTLPKTETYQLWLVKDGQRIDGGVFNVDGDGYSAHWVHAPDPLGSYENFGITIEPAGGSPAPTSDKVLGN